MIGPWGLLLLATETEVITMPPVKSGLVPSQKLMVGFGPRGQQVVGAIREQGPLEKNILGMGQYMSIPIIQNIGRGTS